MEFLCSFVGHRRSRRWARRHQDIWRSHCVRCGIGLQRVAPRKWIVMCAQLDEGAGD